jgi:hypothetical protein
MKRSHRGERQVGMTSVTNKLNREMLLLSLRRDLLIRKNLFRRSECLNLKLLVPAGGMQVVDVALGITKSPNLR